MAFGTENKQKKCFNPESISEKKQRINQATTAKRAKQERPPVVNAKEKKAAKAA